MPNFVTPPTGMFVGKNAPLHPEYESVPGDGPSDSVDVPLTSIGEGPRALTITGAGNVTVNLSTGGTAVLTPTVNTVAVCAFSRILATGTTATGITVHY